MVRLAIISLAFVIVVSSGAPECLGKNNNNKPKGNATQEKKDDQKVRDAKEDFKKAQEKLKDDQKDMQDAQKSLTEAQSKEKVARQELDDARKRIEAKHEKSSGNDNALAEQEAAKKAYDKAAAPVLKTLKATPEYQAAAKKAAEAQARLKTIREDDRLAAGAKRNEIAQASKDTLATSELERIALEGDSSAKTARATLADAQERVKQLRAKTHNLIEADPDIKSAQQALRAATDDKEAAGQKLQRIREKVAADTAKLGHSLQQVKQAEAADKANDNRNQKNKR